jgi:hypothetical protein
MGSRGRVPLWVEGKTLLGLDKVHIHRVFNPMYI